MDVSHFELIWKPQAPAAPSGTPAVATVLQGYFLKITNLESVTYSFRVEFVAAPVADPLRSLSGNTVVFVDTPGTNNAPGILNGAITDTVFTPSTGLITIPPLGTALVAVLPQAFGPAPGDNVPLANNPPRFEVRGHVRIRLPATFRQVGNSFRLRPQSDGPVRVLLTPQHRASYFDANRVITDQTQSSLPLAGGSATVAVPPGQGPVVLSNLVVAKLAEMDPETAIRPEVMMASLAMLGDGDLGPVNDVLEKAGISLTLSRPKRT
jgi:hypothetical protein